MNILWAELSTLIKLIKVSSLSLGNLIVSEDRIYSFLFGAFQKFQDCFLQMQIFLFRSKQVF